MVCLHGVADEPHSVGLENMAQTLRGDVRLIAMGDSYSAPFLARVPLAGLRVWPIPNIMALGSGACTYSAPITCTPKCNPVSVILSSDSQGYTVERNTLDKFFTLPIFGIQEIFTSIDFDDQGSNQLFTFQLNTPFINNLSSGVHGPFVNFDDNLKFRFLYRCPTNLLEQIEEVRVVDNYSEVGTIQLRTGSRPLWHLGENPLNGPREAIPKQINASANDFSAINNTTGTLRMHLEQTSSLAGTNQYFEPSGCVYYHQNEDGVREQGLFFSYLADGSWSYSGFGCDTEGIDTHDKRFSLEQFTHWLDVTTLDRDQPTVFMWYLAPEALSYDYAHELMSSMIDQAEAGANLVGLTSFQHLFVISHLFDMYNTDIEIEHQYFINQQNAAYDLAATRQNVSAASIYAATDKVMFTGPDAVQWLINHGFESFEFGINNINLAVTSNGDLLDLSNVHPKNDYSAAFFAAVLGDIIREAGCPADIVNDGYINTNDLIAVINGWEQQGETDINGDGVTNVTDIIILINSWGECWPVQAPFNTPAFRSK
jgi:hypothetical protein